MAKDVNLMAEIDLLGEKLLAAKRSITRQFIGQEDSVELALTTLLCGGHALLMSAWFGQNQAGGNLGRRDGPTGQPGPVHPRFEALRYPRIRNT
jgi:hypothetical protein